MKIGCCARGEDIRLVPEIGFDFLELPGAIVARMEQAEYKELLHTVRGLPVPASNMNMALPGDVKLCGEEYDPAHSDEYFRQICSRAAELGVKGIGVGSPNSRADITRFPEETAWRQAQEAIGSFCDIAKPYGISVLWEALSGGETNFGICMRESVEKMVLPLLNNGTDNTGLVCDLFHMSENGETAADAEAVLPYIKHVHIAGSDRTKRGYPTLWTVRRFRDVFALTDKMGLPVSIEALEGSLSEDGAEALAALRTLNE